MKVKLFRAHFSNYDVSNIILAQKKYRLIPLPIRMFCPRTPNQGFGRIKGNIKKMGQQYQYAKICCFDKASRLLLWEVSPTKNGAYHFRNIKEGVEHFIIAFDLNNQCNAVIQDKVIAK